jgi:hypothetical protein
VGPFAGPGNLHRATVGRCASQGLRP